jgi:hypothetical protein
MLTQSVKLYMNGHALIDVVDFEVDDLAVMTTGRTKTAAANVA